MTQIVAVPLQKGGVGKTAITVNLGAALAERGQNVLLIDLDPTPSLSRALGIENPQYTIYEVLTTEVAVSAARVTVDEGLWAIPSSSELAAAEITFQDANRFFTLDDVLTEDAVATYDFVLIDVPPTLGFLLQIALVAADEVLVPLQVQPLALHSISELEETLRLVRHPRLNATLGMLGIVLTFFDRSTTLSRRVEQDARQKYGALVLKTHIPRNVDVARAVMAGAPVTKTAPNSTGAKAFLALADEILTRGGNDGR